MDLPTLVDPVKEILLTSGWSERVDRHRDVDMANGAERITAVETLKPCDVVRIRLDRVGESIKQLCSFHGAQLGPKGLTRMPASQRVPICRRSANGGALEKGRGGDFHSVGCDVCVHAMPPD